MIGPLEAWVVQAEALDGVDNPSLDQVMDMMAGLGGIMARVSWLLPISLIVGAMLAAAVARGGAGSVGQTSDVRKRCVSLPARSVPDRVLSRRYLRRLSAPTTPQGPR
jgi:hypothetical protein